MDYRFPTPEQIRQRLLQGCSYAEAIDGAYDRNIKEFSKYANFKLEEVMSNKNDKTEDKSMANKNNKIDPEDINRETFRWRTGDKEHELDEMDLDLKLVAYIHSLKKANDNFEKRNKYRRKAEICHNNTKYFMRLCEVLEDSLLQDHDLQVPSEVEDVRAMRRMIKEGVITVGNFNNKEEDNGEEDSD